MWHHHLFHVPSIKIWTLYSFINLQYFTFSIFWNLCIAFQSSSSVGCHFHEYPTMVLKYCKLMKLTYSILHLAYSGHPCVAFQSSSVGCHFHEYPTMVLNLYKWTKITLILIPQRFMFTWFYEVDTFFHNKMVGIQNYLRTIFHFNLLCLTSFWTYISTKYKLWVAFHT